MLFRSRYRSNERDESNGVIYKDVCNPITAEFREELYTNILDAYARIREPEKEETQKRDRIQEMPEFSVTVTPDEVVDRLEKKIQQIDSVTQMLDRGLTPEQILDEILGEFGLEITEKTDTRFHCDCSKERVSRALSTLSKKDLDGIIADGEDIEVKCQFCNTAYKFTVDELKEMR